MALDCQEATQAQEDLFWEGYYYGIEAVLDLGNFNLQ